MVLVYKDGITTEVEERFLERYLALGFVEVKAETKKVAKPKKAKKGE